MACTSPPQQMPRLWRRTASGGWSNAGPQSQARRKRRNASADRHPPAVSFRPHLWGQVESPEGRSLLVGVTAMRQRLFRQAMSLAALLVPLASPARGQETANGSHRPDSKVVITAVGI